MDKIQQAGGEAFDKSFSQPSMKKLVEDVNNLDERESMTYLVSNGIVDINGNIADKRTTGGWKASPFIIVNEVAERLAFFAIAVNMVTYLVSEMNESVPTAVTHTSDWIGAAYVLTLLGAFLADAYLGKFKTILIFSCIYAVGMVLLTISASIEGLRPPACTAKPCTTATNGQAAFLFSALALIALGTGGIKPCVSSFGADQYDEQDGKEVQKKFAFFNWFFFAINMGALLGITVLVYLNEKKGSGWGFGVPAGAVIVSILIFASGMRFYRYQKPLGSPLTRFLQVTVASLRNHFKGVEVRHETALFEVSTAESDIKGARKLSHTTEYGFLDKAAVATDVETHTKNRWRLCTVTQVEEFKSFIRILPVWLSTISLSIAFAQLSTFFLTQASIMDRNFGHNFTIPTGSVPFFAAINPLLLVPIYEKLIIPVLRKHTGQKRGLTSLQRIGVGLFISIIAMTTAALVEKKRLDHSPKSSKLTVFWLFPQFFLIGAAEVFSYVGMLEFFYDEATDGTRSLSSALFLSEIGCGSWLNTAIVKIIERATGGQENGWLRNNLNESRLDYFYWVLTAISGVNFFVYLFVSWRFRSKSSAHGAVAVADETTLLKMVSGRLKETKK